jgi:hypothetical protein
LGEQALSRGMGIGKRSALVAEQLRFEQRIRQAGTIHGDERKRRPRTHVMNGPRSKFLPGTGFTHEQDGGV